jgi:hypothetical protein
MRWAEKEQLLLTLYGLLAELQVSGCRVACVTGNLKLVT